VTKVTLVIAGACDSCEALGVWACIRTINQRTPETLHGVKIRTTCNAVLLEAILAGSESLKEPADLMVLTDSDYVKMGIKNWFKPERRQILDRDPRGIPNGLLWQKMVSALEVHSLTVYGVPRPSRSKLRNWLRVRCGHSAKLIFRPLSCRIVTSDTASPPLLIRRSADRCVRPGHQSCPP
jgi:ribonuclease HI